MCVREMCSRRCGARAVSVGKEFFERLLEIAGLGTGWHWKEIRLHVFYSVNSPISFLYADNRRGSAPLSSPAAAPAPTTAPPWRCTLPRTARSPPALSANALPDSESEAQSVGLSASTSTAAACPNCALVKRRRSQHRLRLDRPHLRRARPADGAVRHLEAGRVIRVDGAHRRTVDRAAPHLAAEASSACRRGHRDMPTSAAHRQPRLAACADGVRRRAAQARAEQVQACLRSEGSRTPPHASSRAPPPLAWLACSNATMDERRPP